MKIFYPTIFLLLLILSCKKKDEPTIPIYDAGAAVYGFASGQKNGFDFEASCIAGNSDSLGYYFLTFGTFSSEGFSRESISFQYITSTIQNYQPKQVLFNGTIDPYFENVRASYSTLQDDGDVQEDYYVLDESAEGNFLNITKMDTVENKVEGVFTIHMMLKPGEELVNPDNPLNVTFSDVEFSLTIRE